MTRRKTLDRSIEPTYDAILADVVGLIDAVRHAAVRSTNAIMTATYWAIGRRIVEHEQHGAKRAAYGEELVVRLSGDLHSRFGRGFGRANLFQMRSFYLAYRDILQTASGESAPVFRKVQAVSGLSADRKASRRSTPSGRSIAWRRLGRELDVASACRDTLRHPYLHLAFDPTHGANADLDPVWKSLFRFELVNHGTSQAGYLANLRQAKNLQ